MRIFVPGMGYASHSNEGVYSNFWISCSSIQTGSQGGAVLSLCGNGFDPVKKPRVYFENQKECDVLSWDYQSLKCRIPDFGDTLTHYFNVTMNPLDPVDLHETDYCGNCKYTADPTKTFTISSVSPTTVNTPAAFTITLSGVTGMTGTGTKVLLMATGAS